MFLQSEFFAFYEQAKRLLNEEEPDFRELGRILLKLVEFLKLELLDVFPEPTLEEKPQRKENRLATTKEEEPEELQAPDLAFLYPYTVAVGRPKGSKNTAKTLQEFVREFVPLHREVNYEEKAKELVERIRNGEEVRIQTLSDFIALLYAFQSCELEEDEIFKLLQTTERTAKDLVPLQR